MKKCFPWLILLFLSPKVWCQELLVTLETVCEDTPLLNTELNIVRLKDGTMAFKHRIHILGTIPQELESEYMPFEYVGSRRVNTNSSMTDYLTLRIYPEDGIGEAYETEFIIRKDAYKHVFAFQYRFEHFFAWTKCKGVLSDYNYVIQTLKKAKCMSQIQAKQGKLNVNKREGIIYVNGEKVNKFPIKLSPGNYHIEQCKEDYRTTDRTVQIVAGKYTEVTLPLVKKHGVLNINVSPEGAGVWVDTRSFEVAIPHPLQKSWKWDNGFGKDWNHSRLYLGKSPIMELTPLPGGYEIIIEKDGYAPIRKEMYINDGDLININDTMSNFQSVKIYTVPFLTSLTIDGKKVGRTPWDGELSVGKHEVLVHIPQHMSMNPDISPAFQIEVKNGGRNSFTLDRECSSVRDRNGLTYKVVRIGNQCWMAEDYKPDGREKKVHIGIEGVQMINSNVIKTGDMCTALGEGWHLPYRSDWKILLKYVGNNPGSKLKSKLKSGIDLYDFNALSGPEDSKIYYYTCKGKKISDRGVYLFTTDDMNVQFLTEWNTLPPESLRTRCVKSLEP